MQQSARVKFVHVSEQKVLEHQQLQVSLQSESILVSELADFKPGYLFHPLSSLHAKLS